MTLLTYLFHKQKTNGRGPKILYRAESNQVRICPCKERRRRRERRRMQKTDERGFRFAIAKGRLPNPNSNSNRNPNHNKIHSYRWRPFAITDRLRTKNNDVVCSVCPSSLSFSPISSVISVFTTGFGPPNLESKSSATPHFRTQVPPEF